MSVQFIRIDSRWFVNKALGTKAIDQALAKRDALIRADDEYWMTLSLEAL